MKTVLPHQRNLCALAGEKTMIQHSLSRRRKMIQKPLIFEIITQLKKFLTGRLGKADHAVVTGSGIDKGDQRRWRASCSMCHWTLDNHKLIVRPMLGLKGTVPRWASPNWPDWPARLQQLQNRYRILRNGLPLDPWVLLLTYIVIVVLSRDVVTS